jgi:hypothetical protein
MVHVNVIKAHVEVASVQTARGSGTALLLWTFAAAMGAIGAAMISSASAEVGDATWLGSPATSAALVAVATIVVAGAFVAWRPQSMSRGARRTVAGVLFATAAAAIVLALSFRDWPVVGILVLESAIFIVPIAARVHASTRTKPSAGGDR